MIIKFGAAGISKPAIVNFATRFVISLSFVILVLAFSSWNAAVLMSAAWRVALLTGLTWLVAKSRGANVIAEIIKHMTVAALVIAVSRMIGMFISTYVH